MPKVFLACIAMAGCCLPPSTSLAKPADQQQNGQTGESQTQPAKSQYPYDPHARGPYYGALVPPPPETFDQKYPVCTAEITDGCLNPNQLKRMKQAEAKKDKSAENAKKESGE
jgi:hypothetical protein